MGKTFKATICDSLSIQEMDGVLSYQGSDGSGSFSLLSGHSNFLALTVAGISTLRFADTKLYLAAPQLLVEFELGELYLTGRRIFIGNNEGDIFLQLQEWMLTEELAQQKNTQQIKRLEHELMHRLTQLDEDYVG